MSSTKTLTAWLIFLHGTILLHESESIGTFNGYQFEETFQSDAEPSFSPGITSVSRHYKFPVPQYELDLNTNLMQNKGY